MATAAQNAAQLAEVKRKASLGIALTNSSNASNNSLYNQTRASTEAEIKRKAENGIGLTNTSSAANNSMYDSLVAAKNAQQPIIAMPNNSVSPSSYIDGLAEARRNQTLAALEKSRNAGLSNLGAEKTAIQPKYYDAKNQTAAGSQQQARNFAEFMAARGGTGAGSNAQAELTSGMQLQSNLGSLGRQEAADYSDIERRTSDLQNAYQSDVASATAGMEADRMQAMLTDYYNQQQRELQVAGLTGILNGQQTLGGKQLQLETQNQQFNQGMATKQLERSNFESDRQYNFAVGQQEWENNFSSNQFNWQKAQQSWENAFQTKNFEQDMKEAAASRGLQWASLGQRDKEFVAEQAWKSKQFEYTKEQDAIANSLAAKKTSTGSNNAISPQRASFNDELNGLNSKLSSSQISPDQALVTLAADYKSGYYTAAEEAFLKKVITDYKFKQANTNIYQR